MEQIILAQKIRSIGESYKLYAGIFNLTIGIIGNALLILVFTGRRMFRGNQTAFYFIMESISNIGLLLTLNVPKLVTYFLGYDPAQTSTAWCKIQMMIWQAFALFSLFTICFLSFDQYLSTNLRSNWRQKSTLKLAYLLTTFNLYFALFIGITALFTTEIQPSMGCNTYNPIAKRYYSFFYYPIIANILPVVITSTTSLLAYWNVRRIVRLQLPVFRRRLDHQMTAMTLARVMILIILGFPYVIISLYSLNISIDDNDYVKLATIGLLTAVLASLMHANFTVNQNSKTHFLMMTTYVYFRSSFIFF